MELACHVRLQGRIISEATSSEKATERSKPMKLYFANCMVVLLVLAATLGCVVGKHPLLQKLEMKESVLENELSQALQTKGANSIADELKKGKSVDYGSILSALSLGNKCLTGPGKASSGNYGPWNTAFYFPKKKRCKDKRNTVRGYSDDPSNCIMKDIANYNINAPLIKFIDVTMVRYIEGQSFYYFECKDGKESCNTGHFRNGRKGTLCYLLNRKSKACEQFKPRHYEANGCSKPDCTDIKGLEDPRVDVKIHLTLYVDAAGAMRHSASFFRIKRDSSKTGKVSYGKKKRISYGKTHTGNSRRRLLAARSGDPPS